MKTKRQLCACRARVTSIDRPSKTAEVDVVVLIENGKITQIVEWEETGIKTLDE